MEEVHQWTESQAEYWAREVVWSFNELRKNDIEASWNKIRRMLNLRRVDFYRCKDYISSYIDDQEAEFIRNLI